VRVDDVGLGVEIQRGVREAHVAVVMLLRVLPEGTDEPHLTSAVGPRATASTRPAEFVGTPSSPIVCIRRRI
jgi:hypothetical protein